MLSSRVRCASCTAPAKTASAGLPQPAAKSLAIPRGIPAFFVASAHRLQPPLFEHNSPRAEIMSTLLQLQRFRPPCNGFGWQTDQRVQHLKGFTLMTKRSMRNLPGVILMTTALAWNLPVLAQSGTVGGTQTSPAANSGAGLNQAPNQAPAMGAGSGINGTSGAGDNSTTGAGTGLNSNGLPQGFSPAMPASSPKTMSSPEQKAPGEKSMQNRQR